MKNYHIKVQYEDNFFTLLSTQLKDDSVSIEFRFPFAKIQEKFIEIKGHYFVPCGELTWTAHEVSKKGYRELATKEFCLTVDITEQTKQGN